MKRNTRVRALEGRMVESVTIFETDQAEGEMDYRGPALEIRVTGGYVFTFTAAPVIIPQAVSTLGRLRKNGDLILNDPVFFGGDPHGKAE